jgi:Flp pilus assembly pilin Flp
MSVMVAFVRDDSGQDIIEYGLLAAFIGIVCIAVWASIEGHLRDAYLGYDSDIQGLWQPPNPGGSD